MNDKRMNQLKKDYLDTPIPETLDSVVKETFNKGRLKVKKQRHTRRRLISSVSIAASFMVIIIGINTNSVMAETLVDLPIIGNVVKVLIFREYKIDEDSYHGDIVTPKIEGLKDLALQEVLNEKYLEENKRLYDEFMTDVEDLKKDGGGFLGVDSGYIVKTDTEEILAIGRYTVNTIGSSSTVFEFDTISKKDNILITLPSLFIDKSYVDIISENIIKQMHKEMELDENKAYWIKGDESIIDGFEKISSNHSFYINADHKLVISFNKYEVAPGSMGVIEFIIPSDILSDVLVSRVYVK